VEGSHCELAARGYSRDGKKGREQIEYGLLTDPQGRPVAIRVFAGNTADPSAFIKAVDVIRDKFRLAEMVMVGDPGGKRARPRRPAPGPGTVSFLLRAWLPVHVV
jgi:transposase